MSGLIVSALVIASFFLGVLYSKLTSERKCDGRMVVGKDEYFVAITISPEEIVQKDKIILRVFSQE